MFKIIIPIEFSFNTFIITVPFDFGSDFDIFLKQHILL